MYTLIRSLPWFRIATEQLPALVVAMLTAEVFYKFHSFVLECLAFLLTWFITDGLIQFGRKLFRARK
ncbi:hypothetical protein [Larkinella humicola]|jgi:hypothetical protein|uniref:Uncharacterized protein n=1 Tax=Larkinella humicola TaxID=2607654 RepID=A0A5N1JRD6_9BACT|nr:hypothetical protein [Larkinella humicola]KAA9356393.1 hypothetical protein F0P93_01165 [Larkinella humicola]